ncbi:hypothetical protein AX774_g6188 [Zancudomyces culisetae]|uniref:RRM Nup35-type domain-containing protein n=1 Tax=Zancudomyces culisetae TaxID=1213189 RepID=A0A1R1PHC3_ZANCU|nr:hypothetical protein AX774_g6188 [Zancudomyces culisetae]|eukprot:OMH80376.1 hypothetical protein AX774_g6188 [Zancudomyces culisetae]
MLEDSKRLVGNSVRFSDMSETSNPQFRSDFSLAPQRSFLSDTIGSKNAETPLFRPRKLDSTGFGGSGYKLVGSSGGSAGILDYRLEGKVDGQPGNLGQFRFDSIFGKGRERGMALETGTPTPTATTATTTTRGVSRWDGLGKQTGGDSGSLFGGEYQRVGGDQQTGSKAFFSQGQPVDVDARYDFSPHRLMGTKERRREQPFPNRGYEFMPNVSGDAISDKKTEIPPFLLSLAQGKVPLNTRGQNTGMKNIGLYKRKVGGDDGLGEEKDVGNDIEKIYRIGRSQLEQRRTTPSLLSYKNLRTSRRGFQFEEVPPSKTLDEDELLKTGRRSMFSEEVVTPGTKRMDALQMFDSDVLKMEPTGVVGQAVLLFGINWDMIDILIEHFGGFGKIMALLPGTSDSNWGVLVFSEKESSQKLLESVISTNGKISIDDGRIILGVSPAELNSLEISLTNYKKIRRISAAQDQALFQEKHAEKEEEDPFSFSRKHAQSRKLASKDSLFSAFRRGPDSALDGQVNDITSNGTSLERLYELSVAKDNVMQIKSDSGFLKPILNFFFK